MKMHVEFNDVEIIEKLDMSDLSMKALHVLADKVRQELEDRTHIG